jgi:trehalose 6-phosphate phosphatase
VNAVDEALQRAAAADALFVGLDFDGVLSEIVAHPDDAIPVPGVAGVLQELVDLPGVRVAAMSGRRRDDLAERLDPPAGVLLVGEHGADSGEGELPSPATYEEVMAVLEDVAAEFPGAWVEQKRTGLTLHGRALTGDDATALAEAAVARLESLVPGSFDRGNRVVDVRLTGATKGGAILALRAPGESVLYIGDDTTDETVFTILGSHDVGIKVGDGDTAASSRLADPRAVVVFLGDLVTARRR